MVTKNKSSKQKSRKQIMESSKQKRLSQKELKKSI